MKDELKDSILKQNSVADLYHTKGIAQTIARSTTFEYITLAVIGANSWWLAVDADYNTADVLTQADPIFQIAEHFFCAYFSFEWAVRLMAFRRKRDSLTDAWFIFDSALVSLMVLETWIFSIAALIMSAASDSPQGGTPGGNLSFLKIVRLLRLTRMAQQWTEEGTTQVDKEIDRDQFFHFLRSPKAVTALVSIGVDVLGVVDGAEYLFKGDGKTSFPEFMDWLLDRRGSNVARVRDIVDLRKVITQEMEKLPRLLGQL